MSDEVEVIEPADSTPSEGHELDHLQASDPSLRALLKVLLNIKTLPHILLILTLSTPLYLLANNGQNELSAFCFLSLSLGYLTTGLFSNNARVKSWTQLPDIRDPENSTSLIIRVLKSFRICLFPLGISLGWFVFLQVLFNEGGPAAEFSSLVPFVLGTLFLFWAVMQGRSFARWLASVAAYKLPSSHTREGGLIGSMVVFCTVISIIATAGLAVFVALHGEPLGVLSLFTGHLGYFLGVGALLALSLWSTRHARELAGSKVMLHRFSNRWLMLSQIMITWHFLTVWRHRELDPSTPELLLEEVLLMMSTVFMAIWGLTSKSFRSSLRLVHEGNALTVGLSFGYAYAGSVAMLATVFDDFVTVMVTGHIVVILTFLWMQRKVLNGIITDHDATVKVNRTVESIAPAPVAHDETKEPGPEEASETEQEGVVTPSVEVGAIGENVDWEGATEVLAEGVDWDDEIELLD